MNQFDRENAAAIMQLEAMRTDSVYTVKQLAAVASKRVAVLRAISNLSEEDAITVVLTKMRRELSEQA